MLYTFLQGSCSVADQVHGDVLIRQSVLSWGPCINDDWCHGKSIQQVTTHTVLLFCHFLFSTINLFYILMLQWISDFMNWISFFRLLLSRGGGSKNLLFYLSGWVRLSSGLFAAGRSSSGSYRRTTTALNGAPVPHNTRELISLLNVLVLFENSLLHKYTSNIPSNKGIPLVLGYL